MRPIHHHKPNIRNPPRNHSDPHRRTSKLRHRARLPLSKRFRRRRHTYRIRRPSDWQSRDLGPFEFGNRVHAASGLLGQRVHGGSAECVVGSGGGVLGEGGGEGGCGCGSEERGESEAFGAVWVCGDGEGGEDV